MPGDRPLEHPQDGAVERRVHHRAGTRPAPAVDVAAIEPGDRRHGPEHPGQVVRDGDPRAHRGPVGLTGEVEQAPVGDAEAIEAGALGVRAVLAEHRHPHPHEIVAAVVGADVPALHGPWAEVLAHHVGCGHEAAEQVLARLGAQVAGDAAASPPLHRPEQRVVVDEGPDVAHEVAGAGVLDLDHLGAQLSEQPRAERRRDAGPHVDHPEPLEGPADGHGRGRPSTRSPTMVRWISLVPAQIDDAW